MSLIGKYAKEAGIEVCVVCQAVFSKKIKEQFLCGNKDCAKVYIRIKRHILKHTNI